MNLYITVILLASLQFILYSTAVFYFFFGGGVGIILIIKQIFHKKDKGDISALPKLLEN